VYTGRTGEAAGNFYCMSVCVNESGKHCRLERTFSVEIFRHAFAAVCAVKAVLCKPPRPAKEQVRKHAHVVLDVKIFQLTATNFQLWNT